MYIIVNARSQSIQLLKGLGIRQRGISCELNMVLSYDVLEFMSSVSFSEGNNVLAIILINSMRL